MTSRSPTFSRPQPGDSDCAGDGAYARKPFEDFHRLSTAAPTRSGGSSIGCPEAHPPGGLRRSAPLRIVASTTQDAPEHWGCMCLLRPGRRGFLSYASGTQVMV